MSPEGFVWVKVNGQWLYRWLYKKTRQIVTGRNKHLARWMLWRPNRRAQIPSALRSAKLIRWRPPGDRCRIVACYTSFGPRGRK